MIKSKKLKKLKGIRHGFFNRKKGKSTGIYQSLNCGIGSNDKKDNVKKNLRIAKNKISKRAKDIILLHQVHSNKFVYIKRNSKITKKKFKADTIITNQEKLPIGILTADCVPILIYDNISNTIAAVHAGWKGAYKGIVNKVINFMLKKGCKKENISAAIGPCITQKSYNVKDGFLKKFIKKDKKNKRFFIKRNGIIYFDLPNYVKSQLKHNKISNIDLLNINTFDSKNNFFSARRSLTLNHDDYGRNISIIMIN